MPPSALLQGVLCESDAVTWRAVAKSWHGDWPRAAVVAAVIGSLALWAPVAGTTDSSAARAAVGDPQPAATRAYPALHLAEASGLTASVLHPGVVWVVEDSGDPVVLAFDTTGTQVGSVLFEASDVFAGDNRDTESIAMGPGPTLWSGDIGDNNAARETVLVHTTPEPAALGDHSVTPLSYRFRYPDGPRDAEALLVDPLGGRAYIASKGVFGGGLYAAPEQLVPGATHDLRLVQEVPALVTGGEFSPDGSLVALRTWDPTGAGTAHLYDVVRSAPGEPVALEHRAELTLPRQQQGESLTISQDGSALLVGSEGGSEPIWSVPLPAGIVVAAGATASPIGAPSAAGTEQAPTAVSTSDDEGERHRTCRRRIAGDCVATPKGLRWLVVGGVVVLGVALFVAARRRR